MANARRGYGDRETTRREGIIYDALYLFCGGDAAPAAVADGNARIIYPRTTLALPPGGGDT
jgi:hypothetical protein